jgi:hypothetical protein
VVLRMAAVSFSASPSPSPSRPTPNSPPSPGCTLACWLARDRILAGGANRPDCSWLGDGILISPQCGMGSYHASLTPLSRVSRVLCKHPQDVINVFLHSCCYLVFLNYRFYLNLRASQ